MSELTKTKEAIINMFKELLETVLQEIKEGMRTILHQKENVNKETQKRAKWIFWSCKVQ